MKTLTAILTLAAGGLLVSQPALAHHVMDGGMPQTFMQGLLSGLGHPIIGVDHLAFILAVGFIAAFAGQRYLSPLAFIVATLAGCALQLGGIGLPIAEIVIAGSVVLLGGMILSGRKIPAAAYLGVFAVAGLFHGWAYGQSIVGAEATALTAYLIGFAVIQYVLAQAAAWITVAVWKVGEPAAVKLRLAGAIAAGFGAAFLIENIEGMLVV